MTAIRQLLLLASVLLTAPSPTRPYMRSRSGRAGGQQLSCKMWVVSCNYAEHYMGRFDWQLVLQGGKSRHEEVVSVGITNGVVKCDGTAKDTDVGGTKVGRIVGPGLLAIEFKRDSIGKLVYEVTVACPTPAWPDTPSQPAELGHFGQESYEQPATAIGMNLKGGSSYPAPETDPVNGVTGTVSVSWEFLRKP